MKDTINVEKLIKYLAGFAARMKINAVEAYKAQMLELAGLETFLKTIAAKFGMDVGEAVRSELLNTAQELTAQQQAALSNILSLPLSKQVSAVLPQEDEMLKYKGKTIKKRTDGRWWTRYYDKQGKQHSVYGKTRNDCLNRLKEALRQSANGNTTVTSSITLGEWLTKWAEAYKKPKQKCSSYKKTLENIRALAPLHNFKLKDLTTLTIQNFLTDIPYENKREKIYGIINAALKKAFDCEYIRRNPCTNVELKKHRQKKRIPLSIEDEKKFIEACEKEKGGILYLIMLYQGLRIGEARALLESDIDFANKTITVNKTYSNHILDTPKTEASVRVLPLFKVTADAIKRLGLWRYKGDKQIYELWKRICKKSGIDGKGYTTHCLRHTFGTRCAEWNIELKTCQKWMGHADAQVTLDIYMHVRQQFEQKESSKIDTYFDTYFD